MAIGAIANGEAGLSVRTKLNTAIGVINDLTGGTAPALTIGSIMFAGASGVITQDNANLFWDNTNNRLGIGTLAPDKKLEINLGTTDAFRLTYNDANGSATTYIDTTISSAGAVTLTAVGSTPSFSLANPLVVKGSGITTGNSFTTIDSASNIKHYIRDDGATVIQADQFATGYTALTQALATFTLYDPVGDVRLRIYGNNSAGSFSDIGYIGTSRAIWLNGNNAGTMEIFLNGTARFLLNSSGNLGIGTAYDAPAARLNLRSTTEQLRTEYDATNYFSTTIDSTGNAAFNLTASSGTPRFTFSDAITISTGAVANGLSITNTVASGTGVNATIALTPVGVNLYSAINIRSTGASAETIDAYISSFGGTIIVGGSGASVPFGVTNGNSGPITGTYIFNVYNSLTIGTVASSLYTGAVTLTAIQIAAQTADSFQVATPGLAAVLAKIDVNGSMFVRRGGAAGGTFAKVGGAIFNSFADVTVGGAETDIYTNTLDAGIFGTNADKVIAQYGGNFVTVGTELTQLQVKFAGTTIWDSTGVAPTTGTTSWRVYVELIRVSATVIRYSISLNTTGASGYVYCSVGELTGLTLSGTNILKITGTSSGVGSGAGDIVGRMSYVKFLPFA